MSRAYLKAIERHVLDSVKVRGARAQRGSNLSIRILKRRSGGRIGTGLRWAILVNATPNETIFDNHLVCKFYDPLTGAIGDTAFNVLKPWHLQRDLFDGETIDYANGDSIQYAYDDADYGMVRTASTAVSPSESWEERVHPFYYDGSIFQIMPVPKQGVSADAGPITASFAYGTLFANQITRASGSFITDGFKAGMTLTVEGTASNDGTYEIQAVAALSLTLTTSTLTSETVSSTLTGTADTAEWMDANLQARFFKRTDCLGAGLIYDDDGCIAVDQVVNSQASLTLVTGVSHAIVGGNLRITATRSTVTFKKNAAGMLIDYSVAAAANTTSDVALGSCP